MTMQYSEALNKMYQRNILNVCNSHQLRNNGMSIYDILNSVPEVANRVLQEHPEYLISYKCALKEAKEIQDYEQATNDQRFNACTIASYVPIVGMTTDLVCTTSDVLLSLVDNNVMAQYSEFNYLTGIIDATAEGIKRKGELKAERFFIDVTGNAVTDFLGKRYAAIATVINGHEKATNADNHLKNARYAVGENTFLNFLGASEAELCTQSFQREVTKNLEEIETQGKLKCEQKSSLEMFFVFFSKCKEKLDLQESEFKAYNYYEFLNERCD